MNDRESTQIFAIRNIITSHCGEILTPNAVDRICNEIEIEIQSGPCSWAFLPSNKANPPDRQGLRPSGFQSILKVFIRPCKRISKLAGNTRHMSKQQGFLGEL